jgi:hypothetical protein
MIRQIRSLNLFNRFLRIPLQLPPSRNIPLGEILPSPETPLLTTCLPTGGAAGLPSDHRLGNMLRKQRSGQIDRFFLTPYFIV